MPRNRVKTLMQGMTLCVFLALAASVGGCTDRYGRTDLGAANLGEHLGRMIAGKPTPSEEWAATQKAAAEVKTAFLRFIATAAQQHAPTGQRLHWEWPVRPTQAFGWVVFTTQLQRWQHGADESWLCRRFNSRLTFWNETFQDVRTAKQALACLDASGSWRLLNDGATTVGKENNQ